MRRIMLMVTVALVVAAMMAVAGPASATIHPIVESYDCVGENVPDGHPTGDVASPPGQTFPKGPNGQNQHRAESLTSGGAAFSSNPLVEQFGYERGGAEHKLDGKCGKVGR